MSEVYYKTIKQLEEKYASVRKSKSVLRAIEILKKKAAAVELCNAGAEMEIDDMITTILVELDAAKPELTSLSKNSIMQVIVDHYLSSEHFMKVGNTNEYQLAGVDAMYTFEVYFHANTIMLIRLINPDPEAKHKTKAACHAFRNLPSLVPGSRIADMKILERELRMLRAHLKSTWEYIHIDKTPSVTELSDLTDEDFE